jgi:Fis family transcriptional regulator
MTTTNPNPRAASRATESRAAAQRGETIEECVLRSLHEYFATLAGARPHALHEMVVTAVERPLLKFALEKAGGNQSAAAELLGINRNTLHKKLIEYGLAK